MIPDTCSYKNGQILLRKLLVTFLVGPHIPMLVDIGTCHFEIMIYDCLLNLSNNIVKGLENLKGQGRFKTAYASKKNWQLAAKTLRKSIFEAKQLWYTNIREKWTHSNSQHVREAFQAIRRIGGGSTNFMIPHTKEVMNEEWGTILSSTPKNYSYDENHWKTKVEELMKQESLGSISPIDCHELRNALQKLSNHKSPGLDGIPNEALKMIQHTKFGGALQNILNSTLQDPSKIPADWKKAKLSSFPKKNSQVLLITDLSLCSTLFPNCKRSSYGIKSRKYFSVR